MLQNDEDRNDWFGISEVKDLVLENRATLGDVKVMLVAMYSELKKIEETLNKVPEETENISDDLGMLTAIVNNYIDESRAGLEGVTKTLDFNEKLLTSLFVTRLDSLAVQINRVEQVLNDTRTQVNLQSEGMRKCFELVLNELAQAEEIQTRIKGDTSDIESRLSDIRNRLQTIETECYTIIEEIRSLPKKE